MGISNDMHKDFLKAMRRPNFTDGEWKCERLGNAWAIQDGNGMSLLTIHNEYDGDDEETGDAIVTPFAAVYSECDARLMAQSKKMYEVLRKIANRSIAEPFGSAIELYGCCPFTGNEWMEEVDAILSEIDKE